MSHQFETGMFSNNEAAWHGLGNVLSEKVYDTQQAIEQAGLDWTVSKRPIYIQRDEDEDGNRELARVPGRCAVVRDSDGAILGDVSTRYEPLQNSEAFRFFDPFLHEKDLFISSAVSLSHGKRIAIVAELEDNTRTVVEGDTVKSYLLLATSHDASLSTTVRFTNVRVVCQNTLAVALMDDHNVRLVKHTKSQSDNLRIVQSSIDLYRKKFDEEVDIYRQLAAKEMNHEQFRDYLEEVFAQDLTRRSKDMGKQAALEDIRAGKHCLNNFMFTPDLQFDNVRDTAWGGFNAVTEFIKTKSSNRSKRMESIWFGSDAALLERAKTLALKA